MSNPEIIAIIKPLKTYKRAILNPKSPNNKTKATSFIIGEETKKEKVIPSGTPASTKPKNKGTAEQEQNGVIIPSKEARICPISLFFFAKNMRILSGGRYVLTKETIKIIINSKINILSVSKTKKLTAEAINVPGENFKML